MAAILTKWVNEEVKLSSKVETLEAQLADGVLLAELLSKFRVERVPLLREATAHDERLRNLRQLLPALRELGLKPKGSILEGVATEQRGAAARLLFEVRLALTGELEARREKESAQRPHAVTPRRSEVEPRVRFAQSLRTDGMSTKQAAMASLTKRCVGGRFACALSH